MATMGSAVIWMIVAGLFAGSVGLFGLAAYTIRSSDGDRTLWTFAVLLCLVAVWTTGQGVRILLPTLSGKLLVQRVMYVGVLGSPVVWFVFVLLYTGREQAVDRYSVAGMLVIPAITLGVLATDLSSFYGSAKTTTVDGIPLLTTTAGPFWWVAFAYSYLLLGTGLVVLARFVQEADRLYRFQSVAFIMASLLPILTNAMFVFELLPTVVVDLTPLTFAVSMVLLFVAVFYVDFLDVVPVARTAIVRELTDGVVVVDNDGRICDTNQSAVEMLSVDTDPDDIVGTELRSVEPTLTETTVSSSGGGGVDDGFEAAAVRGGEAEWYWIRDIDLAGNQMSPGTVYTLTDITEKKRFERQLRRLQRTHQRLLLADEQEDIVDIAVESAAEALGLPITGIWRSDGDVLRPLGMSEAGHDLFDEQPVLGPEDLAWEAFEESELKRYTNVHEHERRHNEDTPIESEVHVPIGTIGVMSSGSTTQTEFDDTDFDLLRILAGATERAFQRLEREQRLQQQNDRLEEFTGVVSHDLRSPLNQIDIYTDMLSEEYDDERLRTVREATDRAKEMIDDLLTLARQGDTVEDGEVGQIEATVTSAWQSVATPEATLTIESDLGAVEADHSRLQQVFENLFRNAVEHSVTDPSDERQADTGDVSIRVGTIRGGVYVADDGPGIPEQMRDDVFEYGYTTDESGTGLGLSIVARIVEAHGWAIEAVESRDGGARFEITGMAVRQSTAPT